MNITKATPKDLFIEGVNLVLFKDDVLIGKIEGAKSYMLNYDILPTRFSGYAAYLVLKGNLEITIDCKKYRIGKNGILEAYNYNVVNVVRFSLDFEGYFILISEALYDSIESLTNLDPFQKINLNYAGLADLVDKEDSKNLLKQLHRIYHSILKSTHHYQTNIIYAEITIFLLEFSLLRLEKNEMGKDPNKGLNNSHKNIILQFSRLVLLHCNWESSISFYASKLFITPQYLSSIIKEYSGISAKSWINKARVSKAKTLLRDTKYTIQQVSEEMNFSNMTGFCRFFKQQTKMSPLEYRKKIYDIVN